MQKFVEGSGVTYVCSKLLGGKVLSSQFYIKLTFNRKVENQFGGKTLKSPPHTFVFATTVAGSATVFS